MNDFVLKLQKSDKNNPFAIVIGIDCMTGLQSARILSNRKIPVIGFASNPEHPFCRTNVCDRIIISDIRRSEFIKRLKLIGPEFKEKPVLYPCTDTSVLLISRNRHDLDKWYRIALPDEEIVEILMDKVKFYEFAQQKGLPIPGTFFLRSKDDAETAAQELSFPCILKPPMKTPEWEEKLKYKVFKLANAKEFLHIYEKASLLTNELMIQEWIEGDDSSLFSCNCYFNKKSQPLSTFIARKLRQWPPETGTSCLGEEVRNDDALKESLHLFSMVNYHGLGYVEMKRDSRDGKHYIIEPNIGRPTGRSAISEAGGVELLYTMYCDLVGLPLPANRTQKYRGVKWIYLRRDLQSAWHYYRDGKLTLKEWLKSLKGKKYFAVFSWSDPLPFLDDFRYTFIMKIIKKNQKID